MVINMIDLRKKAEELHDRHSDTFQIEVDEIESQLRTLVEGYSVPLEEAIRSVVNRNAPEYKSSTTATDKSNSQISKCCHEFDTADITASATTWTAAIPNSSISNSSSLSKSVMSL